MVSEDINIFSMQKLKDIKRRPDILSNIKLNASLPLIMKSRFQMSKEEFEELQKMIGYIFYIETACEKPSLMLMKINKSDIADTVGIIEEIPQEMLQRAIENQVHPPVHGMYGITEEIKNWLRKELNLSD
ncbi:MAG: DVU0772 family protein [Thermodesulfovibrionales bacterium]